MAAGQERLITSVGGAVAVLAGGSAWITRQLKRKRQPAMRRPRKAD